MFKREDIPLAVTLVVFVVVVVGVALSGALLLTDGSDIEITASLDVLDDYKTHRDACLGSRTPGFDIDLRSCVDAVRTAGQAGATWWFFLIVSGIAGTFAALLVAGLIEENWVVKKKVYSPRQQERNALKAVRSCSSDDDIYFGPEFEPMRIRYGYDFGAEVAARKRKQAWVDDWLAIARQYQFVEKHHSSTYYVTSYRYLDPDGNIYVTLELKRYKTKIHSYTTTEESEWGGSRDIHHEWEQQVLVDAKFVEHEKEWWNKYGQKRE